MFNAIALPQNYQYSLWIKGFATEIGVRFWAKFFGMRWDHERSGGWQ